MDDIYHPHHHHHHHHHDHDRHAQAWNSAAQAKLAVTKNLIAALQQTQDFYRSREPDNYHHLHQQADPLPSPDVLSPKRLNFVEESFQYAHVESSGSSAGHGAAAGGGAGGGGAAHEYMNIGSRVISDDVVFYVGKSRRAYHVNAQSLCKGSAYFRNLLQHGDPSLLQTAATGGGQMLGGNGGSYCPPIVMDCEEGIFESLLLLMRYGTLEALPPMSAAETFKLKKEAQFYGIQFVEPMINAAQSTGDEYSRSDMSSTASPSSSPSSSPKSAMMNVSPRALSKRSTGSSRCHDGVRLTCSTPRQLAELAEFPLDLADPARLVLVSCLDQEKAYSIYTCDCMMRGSGGTSTSSTQWALNFHHRYAFCTACGRPPNNMSSKHFTEMFMAVAAHYHITPGAASSQERGAAPTKPINYLSTTNWWVGADSTCMLRFVSSAGDGPDACGSCACSRAAQREEREAPPPTIWAANCFYAHAFCTRCTEPAKGRVLLSLLLALRYGGGHMKACKSARSSFRIPASN